MIDLTATLGVKNPLEDPIIKAMIYLSSTDWMVIRQIDNGIPVPADVKKLRQAARITINPTGLSSQILAVV